MEPEEAHSDHRLGPRAADSTTYKHLEEVGKGRLEMAVEDTGEALVDGVVAQPQGRWALVGRRSSSWWRRRGEATG
jgi:hypothetical protein